MKSKKILIVAGEPSGDLHGSNLVKDLKSLEPSLSFFGIGGSRLSQAGVEVVFDISKLALVGALEVVRHIFTVKKAFDAVMARIEKERPDLAILVDYPGFNLRLAAALKKRSIPVVYYISPQVWAWGRDRIDIIKRCVRKMVVFFRFEEELYKRSGIDTEFVGNPLLDAVKVSSTRDAVLARYGLSAKKKTIALLPGSRAFEVKTLLPIMSAAAAVIKKGLPESQFVIAKHPDLPAGLYEDALKASGVEFKIAEADTYNVLAASDFAIVASGTATLETAIVGTPLVVVYKASLVTYMLYKFVATIDFLGLVNIVAGREIAPELLQYDATAEKIGLKVSEMLSDPTRLAEIRAELGRVKSVLGAPGASLRAAKAILPLLK